MRKASGINPEDTSETGVPKAIWSYLQPHYDNSCNDTGAKRNQPMDNLTGMESWDFFWYNLPRAISKKWLESRHRSIMLWNWQMPQISMFMCVLYTYVHIYMRNCWKVLGLTKKSFKRVRKILLFYHLV